MGRDGRKKKAAIARYVAACVEKGRIGLLMSIFIIAFCSAQASFAGNPQYQAGFPNPGSQVKKRNCKECHSKMMRGRDAALNNDALPDDHTALKKKREGNPMNIPGKK